MKSRHRIALALGASGLVMFGSGCAGLSAVSGLMAGPLPRQAPEESAQPPSGAAEAGTGKLLYGLGTLGQCMRDWARPECQHGASPAPANAVPQQSAPAKVRVPRPIPPAGGSLSSPSLGYCLRNWSLPECQNGVAPVSAGGEPREAPNPADPATKPAQGLGALIAVLAILGIAFAAANLLTAAAMAGIP